LCLIGRDAGAGEICARGDAGRRATNCWLDRGDARLQASLPHCPIVRCTTARFAVVEREIVLADIQQQVAAGDGTSRSAIPDSSMGQRMRLSIVEAMHREFPEPS